jgi:hypothetical protein
MNCSSHQLSTIKNNIGAKPCIQIEDIRYKIRKESCLLISSPSCAKETKTLCFQSERERESIHINMEREKKGIIPEGGSSNTRSCRQLVALYFRVFKQHACVRGQLVALYFI